jgi:hypothetical protein
MDVEILIWDSGFMYISKMEWEVFCRNKASTIKV